MVMIVAIVGVGLFSGIIFVTVILTGMAIAACRALEDEGDEWDYRV